MHPLARWYVSYNELRRLSYFAVENEGTLKYLATVYAKNHQKMHLEGDTACSNNGKSTTFEEHLVLVTAVVITVLMPVLIFRGQRPRWGYASSGETKSQGEHEGKFRSDFKSG